MTEPETYTLDVPGAVVHYDVRSNDTTTHPVLLLIGSPMGAEGFVTQAGHFTDRTVVTYDPRGAGRSKRTDGASVTTVEEQADDLHRVIGALAAGPVDIFASSGGAVNALALVARHPDQVHILVAHEPPAAQELPDRDAVLAACHGIKDAYLREGFGPAMAKFIALVSHQGPVPAGFADQPGPDPAAFGMPAVDDGSRDDALLCLNMPSCPGHRHDFDALRAASARIVIGVGAQSATMLAGRAGIAVAGRLGTEPVTFPGGHDGFLGGEYGGMGEPDAFAATLRQVLTELWEPAPACGRSRCGRRFAVGQGPFLWAADLGPCRGWCRWRGNCWSCGPSCATLSSRGGRDDRRGCGGRLSPGGDRTGQGFRHPPAVPGVTGPRN